jgi:hypothetical protein
MHAGPYPTLWLTATEATTASSQQETVTVQLGVRAVSLGHELKAADSIRSAHDTASSRQPRHTSNNTTVHLSNNSMARCERVWGF